MTNYVTKKEQGSDYRDKLLIWHTPLHGHPQAKLQHYAVNMNSVHVVMYKYMYVETLCYNIKTHRDRHTNAYICTHIDNNNL